MELDKAELNRKKKVEPLFLTGSGDQEREGVGWGGWKERQVFVQSSLELRKPDFTQSHWWVGNTSTLFQASERQSG